LPCLLLIEYLHLLQGCDTLVANVPDGRSSRRREYTAYRGWPGSLNPRSSLDTEIASARSLGRDELAPLRDLLAQA
jgi:hypothetical protein